MNVRLKTILLLLAIQGTPPAPLASRLSRAESEHDQAGLVESLTQLSDLAPTATTSAFMPAIPPLVQAATDPNPHIRSLALLALTAFTNRSDPGGTRSEEPTTLLQPFLPTLAQHLKDPDPEVRQLTALFLGGFPQQSNPALVATLLSALDHAGPPTTSDLSVIVALLTIGPDLPAHPEVAPAILHLLHRRDLTSQFGVRLLNVLASHPHHSMILDAGLLSFLEPTQRADLRAALILVLPRLAISRADFLSTRTRLADFAAAPAEDPTVKAAANEILPCWKSPRMADPCPSSSVHFRMAPQPSPPASNPHR